ncbi:MAG: PQQ-binding-like beta-propeller repeat protein, partial [Nitrososphaerales archaeon]
MDAREGKRLWEFETDGMIWSSPALTENVLFASSLDGHLYSIDHRSGRLAWKFPTMAMIDSSPCIADGMI